MNSRFLVALILILTFVSSMIFLASCNKDEFTEKDAFEQALALSQKRDSIQKADQNKKDSLANAAVKEKDSVTVNVRIWSYPSNTPLSGANIEIFQTKKNIRQTGADGIATFKMLKANAEMSLTASLHGSARFIYSYSTQQNQSVVFLNLQLPKVKEDSFFKITGIVNAEFDLNASAQYSPAPAGVKVTATLQSNLINVINKLNDPLISNVSVFDVPTWNIETTTNANGMYSLNIPAIQGTIFSYRLDFSDFTTNQKLAINRFLDANEPLAKYNLFGDFKTVTVPTNFTSQQIDQSSTNAYTRIPSNVPAFKVEVVEAPSSGSRPLYTAAIVSTPSDASNYNLPLGKLYQFIKLTQNDGTYPSNTPVTLKVTDLRDGTTSSTQYTNNYYYGGSLPTTIGLSNYYYSAYAPSPSQVFSPAYNASYNIATSNGSQYVLSNYATANCYQVSGQSFLRVAKSISILSSTLILPANLTYDYPSQRYYITVQGSGGQAGTLDISYGTGIKSRPVE